MADYASLKVAELKKLLGEKGLSDKGNKPDLVARLKEHDEANGGKPGKEPPAHRIPQGHQSLILSQLTRRMTKSRIATTKRQPPMGQQKRS